MNRQRNDSIVNGALSKPTKTSLSAEQINSDPMEFRAAAARKKGSIAESVKLKKSVSLTSGVALIVGTMIGSGVFISPTGIAAGAGSIGLSLIIWAACGLLSLLGSLAYAELGTMIPLSGGEYSYLLTAFGGSRHKLVGSIPAFLFSWVNALLIKPTQVAIISLACATYAIEPFFNGCQPPVEAVKCLTVVIVLLLTVVNCKSVRLSTVLQNILTLIKLLAAAIITVGGIVKLCSGYTSNLASGFEGTTGEVGAIARAFYNGLWAYDGWNNLNVVTEELVNSRVNLPRAILISIPLVTLCYLCLNISYFTVMSLSELIASPAVAVTWGDRVLGSGFSWIVPVVVVCSTLGAINGSLFSAGRLNYVVARQGHTVELLSMVHVRNFTPIPSLMFTCLLSILLVVNSDIARLIDFFSIAIWFFYGLTMVALLVMRRTMKDQPRPYKVPIVIPIVVLITATLLVFVPVVQNPRIEFLYAFLITTAGLIFYVPFVYLNVECPYMKRITRVCQTFLEVVIPRSAVNNG